MGGSELERDTDFVARLTAMLVDSGPVDAKLARLLNAARAHLGRGPVDRPRAEAGTDGNFTIGAYFLFTDDGAHLDILAPQNFPPEQATLRIPAGHGHPGVVSVTGRPLLLSDTSREPSFVQILKTARMGSAMFHPLRWDGGVSGVMVNAAIQRGTYTEQDFALHGILADLAALLLRRPGRRAVTSGGGTHA